jgi:hypothetical protein
MNGLGRDPTRVGKSGTEVAQEHVDTLISYLERQRGRPLPRYGVELNRSAIAKECHFDRKVFQTNPRCGRLLEEADLADRKLYLTRLEEAEALRDEKAKIDRDRAALESENLKLMAENASLRQDLARFTRLSALIAETGKVPS